VRWTESTTGLPEDFKISRKESKESRYWLRLLDTREDASLDTERAQLIQECTELVKIFSSILGKSE